MTKEQAGRRVEDWIRNRWFAPNTLHRASSLGLLNGVYVPYWTFDAQAEADYSGQRGDYSGGSGRAITRATQQAGNQDVRWRSMTGRLSKSFDDVLVCAGTGIPSEYLYRVGDWNTPSCCPTRIATCRASSPRITRSI